MRLLPATAAVLLLSATVASAAPITTTTKFNLHGLEPVGYKRAVSAQADGAFARAWHTGPVTFGRGGIAVAFLPPMQVARDCDWPGAAGCHGSTGSHRWIVIATGPAWQERYTIDHEILETMVDPSPGADTTLVGGNAAEVCDPHAHPVWNGHYTLASWVGPSYFLNGGIQ